MQDKVIAVAIHTTQYSMPWHTVWIGLIYCTKLPRLRINQSNLFI